MNGNQSTVLSLAPTAFIEFVREIANLKVARWLQSRAPRAAVPGEAATFPAARSTSVVSSGSLGLPRRSIYWSLAYRPPAPEALVWLASKPVAQMPAPKLTQIKRALFRLPRAGDPCPGGIQAAWRPRSSTFRRAFRSSRAQPADPHHRARRLRARPFPAGA
jgi:hypothetical protein